MADEICLVAIGVIIVLLEIERGRVIARSRQVFFPKDDLDARLGVGRKGRQFFRRDLAHREEVVYLLRTLGHLPVAGKSAN